MHILVGEDERALCETIVRSLRRLAYSVDFCYDGDKALALLGVERYDLVLLDLNLPGADGMTVLRTLRQKDRDTKVLILSARSAVSDKVEGLDAGANDYLAKPFHLEELAARIPVSQEELLDHVWDNRVDHFSNSIRVHISALRKKLRAALGFDPIRNRIGEGYVMEEEKP